jgi:primase-polymerase (primpol)-like protein
MAAKCETCGTELRTKALRGRAPRFCSPYCRLAAHRIAHRAEPGIPAELRSLDRWVRYSSRKVPLTTTGRAASSTNPATWSTYAEAVASKAGAGIGFVLNGDGLCCLDLDHCLEDGRPTPAARRFLYKLPRTYIEVSPSGEGLHVWGFAYVPTGRQLVVDGLFVEAYGTGRYMTVTGRPFTTAPLAHLTDVVASLI